MRCWGLAPVWMRGRLTSARSVAATAAKEYRAVAARLLHRRPTGKVSLLGGDGHAAGHSARRSRRGGAQAALRRLRSSGPDAAVDPARRAHAAVPRALG